MIWVDGSTVQTNSAGSMTCGVGPGGAGCFGFGTWGNASDYEATIWDFTDRPRSAASTPRPAASPTCPPWSCRSPSSPRCRARPATAWATSCCSSCPANTDDGQAALPRPPRGAALALIATGCTVNPATGGATSSSPARRRARDRPGDARQASIAEGAAYDDPELQAYVDKIGQRLVAVSDMPDAEFTFTVIDAPEINAYATPGGFVYVNRGLIAYLNSEEQLAGVIGHEIAHVTARHHARRKTASVTNQVLGTTAYVITGSQCGLRGIADVRRGADQRLRTRHGTGGRRARCRVHVQGRLRSRRRCWTSSVCSRTRSSSCA
jgi:hypothetical protein